MGMSITASAASALLNAPLALTISLRRIVTLILSILILRDVLWLLSIWLPPS